MAKLNRPVVKVLNNRPDATTNYEGGLAFTMPEKLELYERVCTCLWNEPKFYGKTGDTENAIIALVEKIAAEDPVWVLKLAVYARKEMNLRTVPQVLLCEVAGHKEWHNKPKPWVTIYGPEIMRRMDECGEVLAYFVNKFGRKVPESLRNAIEFRLLTMKEYEATKYAGSRNAWSLRDVIRFIRPKPENEFQNQLFNYVVHDTVGDKLERIAHRERLLAKSEWDNECQFLLSFSTATWEDAISKFGNKKEVWEAVNIPIMALIRNLRNLVNAGCDMKPYIEMLCNPDVIINSKQFPFRFFSAYKALTGMNSGMTHSVVKKLTEALSDAMQISCDNLERLSGRNFVLCDSSGSMDMPISSNSTVWRSEVAFTLGAIFNVISEDSVISVFGETWKTVPISARNNMLDNISRLANTEVGHATYAHIGIDEAIRQKAHFDRIVILSDMQCYNQTGFGHKSVAHSIKEYRKKVNPNCRVISIDLAGYGTSVMPTDDNKTLLLSGWSERIFDLISVWEKDKTNMVEVIDKYDTFC